MQQSAVSEHCEVPARIVWLGDRPLVEMRLVRPNALDAAFWDDVCADAPITAVRSLDDQPLPPEAGPLCGAIFHTYRCGSTLLCRQLSALPDVYAVAEPRFLDQLVLGHPQEPAHLRDRIVRVLALLSEGLGARARKIVTKWPGLLGDKAEVLSAALPEVPMIFLHRDPVEVLSSIEQRPLGNAEGAPAALGLTSLPGGTSAMTQAAMVIAHLCRRVAQVPGIRHSDYRRLDSARVARYFGLEIGEAENAAMAEAARWYSKAPKGGARFVDDTAQKHAAASEDVRYNAHEILAPALAEAVAALREL